MLVFLHVLLGQSRKFACQVLSHIALQGWIPLSIASHIMQNQIRYRGMTLFQHETVSTFWNYKRHSAYLTLMLQKKKCFLLPCIRVHELMQIKTLSNHQILWANSLNVTWLSILIFVQWYSKSGTPRGYQQKSKIWTGIRRLYRLITSVSKHLITQEKLKLDTSTSCKFYANLCTGVQQTSPQSPQLYASVWLSQNYLVCDTSGVEYFHSID